MQELQQLCELHQEDAADRGDEEEEEDYMNQEENVSSNKPGRAITELLDSMWMEEDKDDEGTDTDGGGGEERGLEEDRRADDLMSGDGEIREEKVNDEELEEIYEFAATQRKREEEGEEEDSMEEKETVDEEEDGEEEFTKVTEPRRSFSVKNLRPNSQLEPDPSLDRSYSRLFSDSWGVYEEGGPSPIPSTSGLAERRTPQSQQHPSPHKPSSELSGRTLLQSSASAVDDLSLSPPPSTSNLPVPGQSPGQVGEWGADAVEVDVPKEGLPLKRDSQGPRSICVPLSPDWPQKKKEPELIVLSDSSEEMEVVFSSRSPSPRPPCAVQNLQSCYTQIKPQPILKPNEPTPENKEPCSLGFSPDDPSSAPAQTHPVSGCDLSPADCSPEVSWLIPSTPLQSRRSTTTISTQTKSSMCRTQLFPKGDTSSPSSSVFSSPALPFNNRLETSNSPTRVSAHVGPTEGSVPRLKLDRTGPCSSSFDLNFSLDKRTSSCDVSQDREVFAVPPCRPKLSHPSSSTSPKQDTPLHIQPRPYSSTPLHTELHQPPVLPTTSPLRSDLDNQRTTSQGRDRAPSESPEKTELGSFHLSPLSDPSDPPSSSCHRGLQGSQRPSESSRQSRRSVDSSSHNNTGGELTRRGIRNEDGERETKCENKGTEEEKAETGEAEVAESSFQQSFMEEPPIAFNDSWGLDACVDLDANPGCFSLRLEDSRGSSQQERSPGQRARSSSSTDCQPSPSSHRIQSSKSRVGVSNSSPSKAHSMQPFTSVQAHSFTPSPPDPTTRTAPEINSSLLDSKIWDSWEEDEEEEALPLSQRVNPSALLKTPGKWSYSHRSTQRFGTNVVLL